VSDKDDRALSYTCCYQPVQQLPHRTMQRHGLGLHSKAPVSHQSWAAKSAMPSGNGPPNMTHIIEQHA